MIFQMHEQHGKHIAYSTSEAESNRKHGWKDVTEEEFYAKRKTIESIPYLEAGSLAEAGQETASINATVPKKRGRPKVNVNGT